MNVRNGWIAAWLALNAAVSVSGAATVVDGRLHHLGRVGQPEWRAFAAERPEADTLTVRFASQANRAEALLRIRQRDVKLDRAVTLNGRRLGRLVLDEADLIHELPIPPGTMRDGENSLEIGPAAQADDVIVGEIRLIADAAEARSRRGRIDATVVEEPGDRPVPCRLTVVDDRGVLVPIAGLSDRLAVRTGVAYAGDGRASLALDPGDYTVYATRGLEYGLATARVHVDEGSTARVALRLRREVATPGLVASDTHVHTLTHSGHGDATADERLITLAGEGIELPIATEHDRIVDNTPEAARLGLDRYLTTVAGVEVTTTRGHFNAFPFAKGEPAPPPAVVPWPDLVRSIRGGRDDRFVILNHPRDIHAGFRPFGPERFNPVVGDDRGGTPYTFDGLEIINSSAMSSDPLRPILDWMALWNHGQEITAVGSSDCHDVSRFIVGQGRTYIACPDDDAGHIDVSRAVRSLKENRAVVSLGLLASLRVDERFGPGDLATGLKESIQVTATVLGPSWVAVDRVTLYANGRPLRDEKVDPRDRPTPEKARFTWAIPRPPHDVALVLVASGPGVTAPYWPLARPYQPTSIDWTPRVLSVTNPIKVDGDANGMWNSPRYYAQFLIEIFGTEPKGLFRMLADHDEATAVQTAAFLLPAGQADYDAPVVEALQTAPEPIRRGFAAYRESVKGP